MVIFDKWLMDFDKLLGIEVLCEWLFGSRAYEHETHKYCKCSIKEIWLVENWLYFTLIPVDYCTMASGKEKNSFVIECGAKFDLNLMFSVKSCSI